MKFMHVVAAVAFALFMTAEGLAHPLKGSGLGNPARAEIVKVQCGDPCYSHSRWRSHNRYGSQGAPYWHDRWRSHHRYGSDGGYWHERSWSHYRWGSYHYHWRECYPCGWDD